MTAGIDTTLYQLRHQNVKLVCLKATFCSSRFYTSDESLVFVPIFPFDAVAVDDLMIEQKLSATRQFIIISLRAKAAGGACLQVLPHQAFQS